MSAANTNAAHDVRAFLAARRRWRGPSLFGIYATLVLGGIAVLFGQGLAETLFAGGISAANVATFGPVVLLFVCWAAARFGSWHGPVGFSKADVAFLLMAPIPVASLVRPRLDHAILLAAVIGALTAGAVIVLVAVAHTDLGGARVLGTILGVVDISIGSVALSWLVQSSKSVGRGVRRMSPFVLFTIVGCGIVEGSAHSMLGVWSGPWGWALAPLSASHWWPAATAALLLATTALVWWGRRRSAVVSIEQFDDRAGTRSKIGASIVLLDYRAAAVSYRAAQPVGRIGSIALPAPRSARLAVAWRDALGLIRDPERVAWAAALGAGAALEATTHPGRVFPALLAAVGFFVAASRLCEPLRLDVDSPDRGWILLSFTHARMLIAHCLIPTLILSGAAAASMGIAAGMGLIDPATLILIPTLLPLVACATVLAAALTARRGGRIDEDLLVRLLRLDPANPASIAIGAIILAPWLLIAVIANAAIIAVVGHAAALHERTVPAGMIATAFAALNLSALLAVARRTRAPQ